MSSAEADRRDGEKTILIVEDEVLIAMAEARMLERHGYTAKTVSNGHDAVREALDGQTDLILMDIDLGKKSMDGTEAARRILAERDVPIVFLTSHSEKEYVDRLQDITRYGYVLKNYGDRVLLESIETAFALSAGGEAP